MAVLKLPDAEQDVLACVRRRTVATAGEVRQDLAAARPMAHGSVLTLLSRLEQRGLVTRRRGPSGKAFQYSPTKKADTAFAPVMRRVLQRLFHNDAVGVVASLFETRPPTAKELDALEALVTAQRRLTKGRTT